jgi:hypothetical protein
MILFLVRYAHLFYGAWVILLAIRYVANYYVFNGRGEETMEDLKTRRRPDYAANTLLIFTFYFEEDDTDSEHLKKAVKYINRFHLFFAVYSAWIFILFLITYGK